MQPELRIVCQALTGLLVACVGVSRLHASEAAHVHGEALLTVAIEGQRVEMNLETPAETLWGFEYQPKSDAEKAKVAAVRQQLADSSTLVTLPAAAKCVQRGVTWDEGADEHQEHRDAHQHHNHNDHDHDKQKHKAHDHDKSTAAEHSDSHQDVRVAYQFDCAATEKLIQFDVAMFKNFSALQRLRVQWVDASRQLEKELTGSSSTFSID